MISLLHEIAAADRDLALPATPEHERGLRLLAWERVTAQVAGHCRNDLAAARVAAQRPYVDTAPILLRHALAGELRPESEQDEWPPLCDVTEAVALIERDRPLRLDGGELVHLASVASDLDLLRGHFLARETACPRWCDGARQLAGLEGLSAAIGRYLDRDGSVRDDATPELSRLRRGIRDGERGVRAEVGRAMAAASARNVLTAPEPTLRGERFCLPVRAGAKTQVDGIVHDRSASGGTLYIEPAAVVQLQNELTERRLAAAAEEDRILLELNSHVEANAADLAQACDFALRVDEICAVLRWGFDVNGAVVVPAADARLDLRQARHPLLLSRETADDDDCVPLDLHLPDDTHVMLISGPNAGGKSVALKCVGLMVLLAQSGWELPARADSTLPLMSKVFVDLGDDQSIARSLSSFSAHLGHLAGFLATADASTLVLCDEIGSGTDPEEGSALAYTVLEELAIRDATVVATTHFSLLKAAVDDHPGMTNAAMEFDEQSLCPLFNLCLGVPGASHAFDIAARLSFPGNLLARARERVGEARFRIERLLVELGARSRRLREAERAARLDAEAAAGEREEVSRRLADIDLERKSLLESAREEGERFLTEARRTLERIVRELRTGGADGKAIRYGRDTLARLRERLPGDDAEAPPVQEPARGDRVRVPHLGLTGRVAEVRGGRIIVNADGMRLTLTSAAVEVIPEADVDRDTAGTGEWRWSAADLPAAHEIDLRGARAEEGWQALDRLIDRAIPAGINEISVIHGFGTGRLRAHLHERLTADERIASFATAPADQGGEGRTIVVLG